MKKIIIASRQPNIKKILVAAVVFCGMFFLSAVNSQAQALYFYITNKTGITLNEINVTPAETTTWGSDILPNDLFYDNTKIKVTIPASYGTSCAFDLRITDLEGGSVVFSGLDACKLLNLTVYIDGTADVENE